MSLTAIWKKLFNTKKIDFTNANKTLNSSHKEVEELEETPCEARKDSKVTQKRLQETGVWEDLYE